MLSKQEHIEYWLKSANDDWEAVEHLFDNNKYVQSLFFCHLVLEKTLKANWVKDNHNNTPPRTHNLVRLAKETHLNLTQEQLLFLEEFNDFQMEGRYPDYLFAIHQRCNLSYTQKLISQVNELIQCLHKKMQ